METKKVTKKSKVWIVGCISFTIGIMLLLSGCSAGHYIHYQHLESGPYPPITGLPEVVSGGRGTYFGEITVLGSKRTARKAAAELGANYVRLESIMIEHEVPSDYLDPYSYKVKTYSGGYSVSLYR